MVSSEEAKDPKSEDTSSPPPEQQQTSHAYSDWAAMQAYYGPRMVMAPYFNSAIASGHPHPPYMWGPMQHMMLPYGAMYPHGGVYAHPGVTTAAKSSGNSDQGLIKKLKGVDGLAMSIGNANGGSGENGNSNSGETGGSSEGSERNITEGAKHGRKRRCGGSSTSSEVGKTEHRDATVGSKKVIGVTVTPGKMAISPDSGSEFEVKMSPNMTMAPSTSILQVHGNERELKREKRKQSNRESARRSRLRKQAEAEELGTKVESLTDENLKLKSEINRLTVNSDNLKLQNAKLLEKLKNAQLEEAIEDPRPDKSLSLSTANLLSRVDNGSGSVVGEATSSGSGAPLHQLMDASPRADAVAAG